MIIVDDLVVGLGCYKTGCNEVAKLPVLEPGNTHSWYVYVVQTKNRLGLQTYLHDNGIMTNIHYARPVHTQPAYEKWYRPCPITEQACEEILSIPCWIGMTDAQVDYVADSILKWSRK